MHKFNPIAATQTWEAGCVLVTHAPKHIADAIEQTIKDGIWPALKKFQTNRMSYQIAEVIETEISFLVVNGTFTISRDDEMLDIEIIHDNRIIAVTQVPLKHIDSIQIFPPFPGNL